MRCPTNSFLVNLAVADMGMAILNCFPSFLYMRDREWVLGPVLCTVSQFTSYLTIRCKHVVGSMLWVQCRPVCSLSVFTLLGLTLERYRVIVNPLAPRTTRTAHLRTLLFIWLVSVIISLPPGLASRHLELTTP